MSDNKTATFPRNRKVQSAIILLMVHLGKSLNEYDEFMADFKAAGHRDIQDILWTELGYNIKYTTYINAIERADIYRPSSLMFQSHFQATRLVSLKSVFTKATQMTQ